MVSKASEDLPEPERPVMTVREFRGISTLMFLRLCWRAPRITSLVSPTPSSKLNETAFDPHQSILRETRCKPGETENRLVSPLPTSPILVPSTITLYLLSRSA